MHLRYTALPRSCTHVTRKHCGSNRTEEKKNSSTVTPAVQFYYGFFRLYINEINKTYCAWLPTRKWICLFIYCMLLGVPISILFFFLLFIHLDMDIQLQIMKQLFHRSTMNLTHFTFSLVAINFYLFSIFFVIIQSIKKNGEEFQYFDKHFKRTCWSINTIRLTSVYSTLKRKWLKDDLKTETCSVNIENQL